MEAKYYVPDLYEFRVGFEFECKDALDKGEEDYRLCYLSSPLTKESKIIQKLEDGKIRVRYLNSNDIESLGFKFIKDDSTGDGHNRWYDLYSFNKYDLAHWNGLGRDYSVKSQIWDNKVLIQEDDHTIFEGTIKNKCELEVLLKQLNIL